MKQIIIGLFIMLIMSCNHQQPTQVTDLPSNNTIIVNMDSVYFNSVFYDISTVMYIPIDSLNTESMQDTIQVILTDMTLIVKLKGTAFNANDSSYRKVDIEDTILISSCENKVVAREWIEEGPNVYTLYTCNAVHDTIDMTAYIGTDINNNMNWVGYSNCQISIRTIHYEQYMFPIGE